MSQSSHHLGETVTSKVIEWPIFNLHTNSQTKRNSNLIPWKTSQDLFWNNPCTDHLKDVQDRIYFETTCVQIIDYNRQSIENSLWHDIRLCFVHNRLLQETEWISARKCEIIKHVHPGVSCLLSSLVWKEQISVQQNQIYPQTFIVIR